MYKPTKRSPLLKFHLVSILVLLYLKHSTN
uniref:Uncharacterized protein n=1 Tax=Anguilla anguilla TaxID=7936 RepID=A0A0E9TV76_ANGAN